MARQNRPQLFDFEVLSSENLSYIPLSVRFHLDRTGRRISLDDWQRLPIDARTTLASYGVEESAQQPESRSESEHQPEHEPESEPLADPEADDFAELLGAWMLEHAGHGPEIETPPAVLLGDDRSALPASVARQCELAALPSPSDERWAALSRFQRYALAKLSRKDKLNHDFVPAMQEFGLIHAIG